MQDSKKLISRLTVIIFILILILPAGYGLIRHFFFKDAEVKQAVPQVQQVTK